MSLGPFRRLRHASALAARGVVPLMLLAGAGAALAFVPLPPGAQVNDDLAAGINKNIGVSGEDPTNADVVGGSLTAGKIAVPWSIFRQKEAASAHDQIFSRSFAGGGLDHTGNRNGRRPLQREPAVQRVIEF